MTREEQVLIRGKVFLYKQKAPFVPSGKSVQGALEYREEDDKVRCHECGEWLTCFNSHLRVHGITAREYKLKHRLRVTTGLMGLRARSRCAAIAVSIGSARHLRPRKKGNPDSRVGGHNVKAEFQNEHGVCPEQVPFRLKRLAAQLGRTPYQAEAQAAGIHVKSACMALNVKNYSGIISLLKLVPNDQNENRRKYTRELLIEMTRDFHAKYNRLPEGRDIRAGIFPSLSNMARVFGSVRQAWLDAGFGPEAEAQRWRNRNGWTAKAGRLAS